MQKKFISSLLLLLLLNVLVKPIWIFGIDLTVQNRVGAAEYGLYAAIFSFTLIFNILLDFGLTHYNNQSIARNPSEVAVNFSRLTGLKLLLGIVYLFISLLLGFFLGYTSQAFSLLLIMTLSQFLASYILFLRSHLSGLHLFTMDSVMSVLDKVLMIISCGLLLFTDVLNEPFTVVHFALAQFGSYLLTGIIGFILVFQRARSFSWKIDFRSYLGNLKSSFPYALLLLLMAMYTRVDSIMLEQISGAFENGIYAQAFRLLDVVNQFGYMFGILLLPIFAGMFGRKENVTGLARLAFSLIFVAALALMLSTLFSAGHIMEYLYVSHAGLSTPVFQILILSSLAFGSTYVFGTLLTARGNLKVLNIVALSGFLLNIVLNAVLIPIYGALGAAVATVFTQFLTAIIQIVLSFRIARITFGNLYWLRLTAFVVMSTVITYAFHLLGVNPWLFMVLNMGVILLVSAFFRLYDVRAAMDLVRSRFK